MAIDAFNAKNKKVRMVACDSRPDFELWVLLHYEKLHPRPYRIADIDAKLHKHMSDYSKAMDGLFARVHDKTETAVQNANFLRNSKDREEADCFTNVDVLVAQCQQN